jgi:hypothetical protein
MTCGDSESIELPKPRKESTIHLGKFAATVRRVGSRGEYAGFVDVDGRRVFETPRFGGSGAKVFALKDAMLWCRIKLSAEETL